MSGGEKFKLPARFASAQASVWVEYSRLAAECKPAVDLSMGFPDFQAPEHVRRTLSDVANDSDTLLQQYTRGFGHPSLVNSLSQLYSKQIGRQLDPYNEILVGIGAGEVLYSAILGHVDVGDEVIVIEPFFDCYEPWIRIAGGIPKFIALKPKCEKSSSAADWVLDEHELRSLFSDKTKMLILNTPNNPLGKVFTQKELELIAELCKKHNVLCLSDEVYEWIVFEPNKHVRIATLPGMWERTITVGSAGKTFSVTGWRLGWGYGPANLMRNLQVMHQNCVSSCPTPLQEAVARSIDYELGRFDKPDCFLFSLAQELVAKRDFLVKSLRDNGFKPIVPDGGYFIIADWTNLASKIDISEEPDRRKDYKFTKKFAKEASVLAIPPTAFYSEAHKHLGEAYARFCFIKKDENLALTDRLLKQWKNEKINID